MPDPLRSTLLVVDDDPLILDLLRQSFEQLYAVHCASSGEAALEILASEAIDLVITDQRLPGITGLDMLSRARRTQPDLSAILLTAYTDPENLIAAINAGHVYRYVVKPWRADELMMTVRNALENVELRRERAGLLERLERHLDTMAALVELGVEAAAPSSYTQLIDVVTRSLHRIVSFDVAATLVVPQGTGGPAAMHLHCQTPADEATLLEARDRAVELYSEKVGTTLGEGQLVINLSGERVRTRDESKPVRSVLSLPLTVDGQIVGALVLVAYQPDAFDDDSLRTLDVLANQTAQAVRRLQDRLLDERRKMALMVESMADGLIMTDGNAEVFLINPAARRLLGLPPDEVITAQYLKDRLGFYPFDLMRGSPTAEPMREEIRIADKILHSIISPVTDGAGSFVGVVIVLRDITAEKLLEQRKDEFVSIVSHELRTPLTSITGALDIVLSQYAAGLSEKQHRYLDMARESSQTLNKIVDDLLDVAKFERGKLSMRMGTFDLAALVRSTVERFRPPAEAKGATITVRAPNEIRVVGDSDRLNQVLNNLLANAIKFTPDQRGRVQVTAFGPGLSTSYAGVSVWNAGEPIPAEARERVFEKFEQLESSTTRKVGGTGLGLAIARGIVEGHGGRIWVDPITDGAKFVFTLPLTPPEDLDADQPVVQGIPAPRRTVLVVDDDREARLLIKGIALAAGYLVDTAADADEALVMAREHKPDCISLDLWMPKIDGFAIVEILKHDPETRGIPVLMLSQNSSATNADDDRDRALHAGADAFMQKPFDAALYAATVSRLVNERGRARQRILLVDDDPAIRMICREVLEGVGYAIEEVGNGSDAIPEVRRFRPDLILLDVMMPDMDGYTLAQRLREERATTLTPVIFLSARGQTADKVKAFKLGAEDYLVKPFDSAELLARVEKALAKREAELSASPTTKLPGSHAIDAEIDRRLALAHAGGGDFAFCYLDLDNLKAFNDYYGYAKADGVIRQTGDIVRDVIAREGGGNDFIGHIAGDDFVFITSIERCDKVCKTVAATFDRLVPLYYDRRDRERGYIEVVDRYGELRRFPIMSVSIAAVTKLMRIRSHSELALSAAELKQKAKAIPLTSYVRDGEVLLPPQSKIPVPPALGSA